MAVLAAALAILGGCTAARWYLDRPGRREERRGGICLTALWNSGGAFDLPVSRRVLAGISAALLGLVWTRRKCSPLGTALVLGGGGSNLYERIRYGRVYDYVHFPKAPGPLKRYVFNLADFAIFAGAVLLLFPRERKG